MQSPYDLPRFRRVQMEPVTPPKKNDPGGGAEPDERESGAPQAEPHQLPDLPEPAEVGEDG
ncbi:hypothetical protein [Paraburkholderia nodosa]|uniref:hypothetical protein n=1 Tax=Paraburkholderia nodosa TaxID=392320 RepID=UPI0008422DC5|nr:hypothetical protein [Paraburkholderia nodosa]